MKKHLALAALATILVNTATAAEIALNAEIVTSCEITSGDGTLDLFAGNDAGSITYSCNVQPDMTITSENTGLKSASGEIIPYKVFVGASDLFHGVVYETAVHGASLVTQGNPPIGMVTSTATIDIFEDAIIAAAAGPGIYEDTLTITVSDPS